MLLQFWWQERRNQRLRAEARHQYAEESLRQQREIFARSQAQQQTLFNSMIEGVLLLDAQGRVLLVNESLRQLLGFSEEIRGKTLAQALRMPALNALAEELKSGKSIFDSEIAMSSNPPRFLQVNAAVVMEKGTEAGQLFVLRDVTRIKQLESIRRDFVANVSHELRTPLCLIRGFSETLLDGAKDDPELTTRFLQKIDKQSHRLLFLIEDLLSISQLESGQISLNLHEVNLREVAQRVLDDLSQRAAERETVIENRIPSFIQVKADADRIQQVFFNLTENAIKYGKPKGIVTLAAKPIENRIEVSVSDDGPGIPPEARNRIFERFYRVDRARSRETGGTGLGLSIVKHIVQAHGGEVWVKSEMQQGAIFYFTIPREN